MSSLRLAAILVVASPSACGGSHLADGGDRPEASHPLVMPLEEFAVGKIVAECERQVRCGKYSTLGICATYTEDHTRELLGGATEGRLHYDPLLAATCLNLIRNMGCNRSDEPYNTPLPCLNAFKGVLAAGAKCYLSQECTSGSCPGGGGGTCIAGTCQAGPAVANPLPMGANCEQSLTVCDDNASCHYASATAKWTCTSTVKLGEACDPKGNASGDCANQALCQPTNNKLGGVCTQRPATGERCGSDTGCDAIGDYCDYRVVRCTPMLLPGQPCAEGDRCVNQAHCDLETSTCVMNEVGRDLGEACEGYGQCLGGLPCIDGACTAFTDESRFCP